MRPTVALFRSPATPRYRTVSFSRELIVAEPLDIGLAVDLGGTLRRTPIMGSGL